MTTAPRGKPTIDPRRLDEVERRWLEGEGAHDIERALSAEWKCTRRAIRKYLAIVRKRLALRATTVDPDAEKQRIVSMLENAYRVAAAGGIKGPDPKAMVLAADRLAELYGLKVQKHQVTGAEGGPLQVARVMVLPPLESDGSDLEAQPRTADDVPRIEGG